MKYLVLFIMVVVFTGCSTLSRWNDENFRDREHLMLYHKQGHHYTEDCE